MGRDREPDKSLPLRRLPSDVHFLNVCGLHSETALRKPRKEGARWYWTPATKASEQHTTKNKKAIATEAIGEFVDRGGAGHSAPMPTRWQDDDADLPGGEVAVGTLPRTFVAQQPGPAAPLTAVPPD